MRRIGRNRHECGRSDARLAAVRRGGGCSHEQRCIRVSHKDRHLSAHDRHNAHDPCAVILRMDGHRRDHLRRCVFDLSGAAAACRILVCRCVGTVRRHLRRLRCSGTRRGAERLSGAVSQTSRGPRDPVFYDDDGARKNVRGILVFLEWAGAVTG